MELFIRIKNGQPFEHPIFADNFAQAFPNVDVNNLPPEFAKFKRVKPPNLGIFEVYEGATYEYVDGIYTDIHHVRLMTDKEKQQRIIDLRNTPHPDGWVFSETNYVWVPLSHNLDASGSSPNVIG
jgi:hypothetical protein